MLISSRGRYALLVMIDLAGHRGGLVPGRQIAERLELSQKYLERILRTLAEAGLIEGSHGKGGGYRLLRSPADYTAGEILRAAQQRGSLRLELSCDQGGLALYGRNAGRFALDIEAIAK